MQQASLKEITRKAHALATLLHGAKVVAGESAHGPATPPEAIARIVRRAEELNQRGIEWHHHVLFPSCRFNKHPGKFTLISEDPETRDLFESVTDQEPSGDLKFIEKLFHSQTTK